MDHLTSTDAIALLARLKAVMEARREELIALDGQVGDSDLGLTMSKGFAAASDAVAGSADPLGKLLARAGMAIAKAAPSTMGTLMATGFMRGGKALEGASQLGTPEALKFWEAFVNGIAERGKAKPGEKTVLDALLPAVEALRVAASSGQALAPAMAVAAKAAAAGLEATKAMLAQHGKAACFGEKTRGLPDAGATVGCLVVETMAQFAAGT